MSELKFNCDQCGLCCQNLDKSPLYNELNRGDGVCIHYDEETKLCEDYENRPLLCNIEQAYVDLFQDEIIYRDYLEINYMACAKLKVENM